MPAEPDAALEADASNPERSSRRARRRVLLGAVAVAVPTIAFVLWWFQPQALLFDDVVDEDFPTGSVEQVDAAPTPPAAPSGDADGDGDGSASDDEVTVEEPAPTPGGDTEPAEAEPTPDGPVELATGTFVSRNRYTVTGTATTFELEDGQRLLRLEDFESTNGPDLFVYLTVAGASDDDAALDADFIDLGVLTGNIGNQNYVIPADVDLSRYDSVVIWCRRFTTSFGVADLTS
jgi:hypothetical protein